MKLHQFAKIIIPLTIIPKCSMHINEMSECIKFQYHLFLNLWQMYLKNHFIQFWQINPLLYIICKIYVISYCYGMVAYSNPIISSSFMLHGIILCTRFQIITINQSQVTDCFVWCINTRISQIVKISISSNTITELFNAYKWDVRMYEFPIPFILKSLTDVFEKPLYSVLTN